MMERREGVLVIKSRVSTRCRSQASRQALTFAVTKRTSELTAVASLIQDEYQLTQISPNKHDTKVFDPCMCRYCTLGCIERATTKKFDIYQAQCPPSILRSAPVMKLLASEHKKTAAPLYSSGLLSLFSMFCVGHSTFLSGYFTNSSSTIAVTM